MKNIIITGAGGLVATELIFTLLKKTDANLYLLSTHVNNICERYESYQDRIKCFTIQSFAEFINETNVKYNICIHTAFSRSSSANQIVQSIDYQRTLIALLKKLNIGAFVNISSQSVYGKMSDPLWKENTPLAPDYLYAMGKYFSEVVTEQMLEETNIKWTNIRLCSVCENARFIRLFVKNAVEGNPILLTAPDQQCSFIDVQDVAEGLVALIEYAETMNLAPVYNLGANLVNTIGEIASMVKIVAEKRYGLKNVNIIEQSSDNHVRIGMDASLFMDTFKWSPRRNMEDMIRELFEMIRNPNRGVSCEF